MGMRAFDGLTQALQREQAMLDRIHGPARRYAEDLQVLDALLQKNMITVDHYADQVTRLNRELEKRPHQAPAGGAGGRLGPRRRGRLACRAATSLAAFAGGGAVEGAIEGVKELGSAIGELTERTEAAHERMVQLKDAYTTLTNAAQKFTDSSHTAAQILDEQRDLAFRLHQPLRAVIETYDAVRDGTDELNLSHREQIELTENLGRALILSNKPLEQAGGIMERLSYAMAAGTISGEELKRTMRQVPELATLWTTSFATTRTGLIKMVEDGKVSVMDLVNVTIQGGDGLTASWTKQVRTVTQWREAVEQAYNTARARGEDALHAMTTALQQNADANVDLEERQRSAIEIMANVEHSNRKALVAMEAAKQSEDAWNESVARANASTRSFSGTLDKFVGDWERLQRLKSDHLVDELNSVGDAVERLRSGLAVVVPGLAAAITSGKVASPDPWASPIDLGYGPEAQARRKQQADEAARRRAEEDQANREYAARAYSADIGEEGLKHVQDSIKDMNPNIEKLKQYGEELRRIGEKEIADAEKYRTDQLTKHWHDNLEQFQRDAETKAKLVAEAFQPVEDAFDAPLRDRHVRAR
jgi:tape measure domain-containing protein